MESETIDNLGGYRMAELETATTTTTTSNMKAPTNMNALTSIKDSEVPMPNESRKNHQQPALDIRKSVSCELSPPPPTVYGEVSILGYNGYIPNVERNGRKNRSKFLLCKRSDANGIKKSRHYIVKQPQATKAMHDKDLHSISFTFSRSQTIIVEYTPDENTDMFQIGRSSEDPIDFVVMDTLTACMDSSGHHIQGNRHHHHGGNNESSNNNNNYELNHQQQQQQHYSRNENASSSQQQILGNNDLARMNRFHRHLAKVGEELLHYAGGGSPNSNLSPPQTHDLGARFINFHPQPSSAQALLLNYPQPNISNLPPVMAEHFRSQEYHQHHHHHLHHRQQHDVAGGGVSHVLHQQQTQQPQLPHAQHLSSVRPNGNTNQLASTNSNSNNNNNIEPSNDRHNIMCKRTHATQSTISRFACRILVDRKPPYTARIYAAGFDSSKNIFLGEKATKWEHKNTIDGLTTNGVLLMHQKNDQGTGGIWREVSVDGGIYAIRESRSAAQKGTRIEDESNILQDGTLIDLCGATLLWRSVDGFKASPTKKSLEEKIDMLNASRPQCPVGLNTLVIPRKPILPNNHYHRHKDRSHHHHHHHGNHQQLQLQSSEKNSHQPYVYLKCGHVQGYHDWGTTDKSNQRTCPICLSVGTVAKLSMGLEPSFYIDTGPLTHVFNPCGHMASERTVEYWCSIKIPHGTHFFHSICPFCATPLATTEPASTKLIFQDDLD